jgi:uncharacterized protein (TIRG00374 family)
MISPRDLRAERPAGRGKLILRWGITALCLVLLATKIDVRGVLPLLAHIDPLLLGVAIIGLLGDRVFQGLKWYPLLRVQTDRFTPTDAIRSTLATYPASILLPSGGSEILRAVTLGRTHGLVTEIGASIVMERVLGLLALLLANLASVVVAAEITHRVRDMLPVAALLAAGGLAGLAVLLSAPIRVRAIRWAAETNQRRVARIAARFLQAMSAYGAQHGTVWLVLVLSVAEMVMIAVILWILALALGTSITLPMLLVVTPIMLVLVRLPLSIWGLGIAEGTLAFLLALLYQIPPAQSVALMLASRFVEICVALPGLALWRRADRPGLGSDREVGVTAEEGGVR